MIEKYEGTLRQIENGNEIGAVLINPVLIQKQFQYPIFLTVFPEILQQATAVPRN